MATSNINTSGLGTGDLSFTRISSASLSRVTGSAPTTLGQYRSYRRNASALTFTETSADPAAVPSSANGFKIYGTGNGGGFTPGDSTNAPSKYEIFVGTNKKISFEFYSSTGRSGSVNTDYFYVSNTTLFGLQTDYNPTTGIVTVVNSVIASATTSSFCGVDANSSAVQDVFFDVLIQTTNAGAAVPRSEVWVHTANGYGSTNTRTPRFSTIQNNIGTAITYVDSATLGNSFTINEEGLYSLSGTWYHQTTNAACGFTLNHAVVTDLIVNATTAERIAIGGSQVNTAGQDAYDHVSVTKYLRAGDIIRFQTNGQTASVAARCLVIINKVSN